MCGCRKQGRVTATLASEAFADNDNAALRLDAEAAGDSVTINDPVTEHSDPLYLHFDVVTGFQWAYAGRGAGRNKIEREQSHDPRDIADDLVQRKDEIARVAA